MRPFSSKLKATGLASMGSAAQSFASRPAGSFMRLIAWRPSSEAGAMSGAALREPALRILPVTGALPSSSSAAASAARAAGRASEDRATAAADAASRSARRAVGRFMRGERGKPPTVAGRCGVARRASKEKGARKELPRMGEVRGGREAAAWADRRPRPAGCGGLRVQAGRRRVATQPPASSRLASVREPP